MTRSEDTWSLVATDFDERLPRRTAVIVKHDNWNLPFAYPADFGRIGWLLDSRKTSTYHEKPVATLSFAEYSCFTKPFTDVERSTFFFKSMRSAPSCVTRAVEFSNMGMAADETFCQAGGGGFVWNLDCTCLNNPNHAFERNILTILTVTDPNCTVRQSDGLVQIDFEGGRLHIRSDHQKASVYSSLDAFLSEAASGTIGDGEDKGRYVVFQHAAFADSREQTIRFGISFDSPQQAETAFQRDLPTQRIRDEWNSWFATLPPLNSNDQDEQRAYYKCWWVARQNYYRHPAWGRTMIEALPVYRGYWQWALPAHETAADLNEELGSGFIKTVIDLFLQHQRDDGYVTHAIYLHEQTPGESWARRGIVQTPHIPWVALRYFNKTGDVDALKNWYPALRKYYDYLCASRDESFMRLHLWAIVTSYDTGLDTTSAFEKVTYGEDGARERFCYPAIFAAERARYEQAMAKMSDILEAGDASFWQNHARLTIDAMNERLWDEDKHWYGVIHEDATLDTRVGVDGLFPLAYRLVDDARARSARESFCRLIGDYGIRTVAAGEPGYRADNYWRGPAWPKSISMGAAAAVNYYPDLVDTIRRGAIRFALKHPSIWECMNADTGCIAKGDGGMTATPAVSSNVGSVELLGALLLLRGEPMLDF